MSDVSFRAARRHNAGSPDQRGPFERDHDRILYSSAFHRLAGITQIVRAGEADYFHTRQQHTLKVAQVGRRLAQACQDDDNNKHWDINPDVVEAACLAHDLGHPPFGHIGETTLNDLVVEDGNVDGYEGNAQSFRIITKLGVRYDPQTGVGLDLTRATLNAVLKYPWFRDVYHPDRSKKWSAYESEMADFNFARASFGNSNQSVEAAIMDWADDIAYSVHDMEDFHRAGALNWSYIFSKKAGDNLKDKSLAAWHNRPMDADLLLEEAWDGFITLFADWGDELTNEIYDGSRSHRLAIRQLTSALIGRYVKETKLSSDKESAPVVRPSNVEAEVRLLKQITREYVISSPALVAQQHGQKKIIEGLFKAIISSCDSAPPTFTPIRLKYLWELCDGKRSRFAADFISSLTERQAIALYDRLYGSAAGSVLDPIVR